MGNRIGHILYLNQHIWEIVLDIYKIYIGLLDIYWTGGRPINIMGFVPLSKGFKESNIRLIILIKLAAYGVCKYFIKFRKVTVPEYPDGNFVGPTIITGKTYPPFISIYKMELQTKHSHHLDFHIIF